jgi:hypothetical protein
MGKWCFAVGIKGKSRFAVGIMGKSCFCCRNCGNLFVGIMGTYFFRRNCRKITFFFFSNFAVGILGTSPSVGSNYASLLDPDSP